MESQPISPTAPVEYVLLRLAMVSDGRRTAKQLASDLKSRLPPHSTLSALGGLAEAGLVTEGSKVKLTDAGRTRIERRYGSVRRDSRRFERRAEPALSFGLAPEGEAAGRLVRPDILRAVTLTRVFNLPLDEKSVTLAQVFSALFQRGMTGLPLGVPSGDTQSVASRVVGDVADIDKLRRTLIRLSLEIGLANELPGTESVASGARSAAAARGLVNVAQTGAEEEARLDSAAFATRVCEILSSSRAGPSADKTPIADVYDAYGASYADAGSLDSFKQRLLAAATEGHLALLSLDEPTALDEATRRRSEIVTPTRRLHFIERTES